MMGRDNVERFVAGCDPVDATKVVHFSSKHFTYINNGPHPVELKFPEGHSFTMPPGMSMMIPPPVEQTFYKHEDYHYGMKRRYIFPFAGQWWHLREQGEAVQKPLEPMSFALLNPLDLYSSEFEKKLLDRIPKQESQSFMKSLIYWMQYYQREPKFKIRGRTYDSGGSKRHTYSFYEEKKPCSFCGISDGPGNCTEQANCLNVSMEAEQKMKQRDAFIDHGAYPAPGDKEFNEQWSKLQAEDDIEQARRESTVAGFRGYKDPKYKPKKR